MKFKIYLFIALLIAVSAVGFALQNSDPVTVTVLKWQWQTTVAFLILTSVLAGLVIAWLISVPSFIQTILEKFGLKFRVRNLEGKLKKKEKVSQKTQEKLEKRMEKQQETFEKEKQKQEPKSEDTNIPMT